jgi:hypothetical protein
MNVHTMAAIGAAALALLGAGCVAQREVSTVSAMVRTDERPADAVLRGVRVHLKEIVTP